MTKLTRYTNFSDLKNSKNSIHTKQSASVMEAELKEFINLLNNNRCSKQHSTETNFSNQSTDGK